MLLHSALPSAESSTPPRVIWSLQPPWELEEFDVPTFTGQAQRHLTIEAARLEVDVPPCKSGGWPGRGFRAGVAAGTWSTPRGCTALAQSGSCPQLLRGEGRVAQLREPGPPRGLQGPGAGRLPAQHGGERASLGPCEVEHLLPSGGHCWVLPAARLRAVPVQPRAWPLWPHFSPRSAPWRLRGGGGCRGVHPAPPYTHTPLQEGARRPSWSPDPAARLTPLLQIRERLGVSLGERPPTLVPVSHVMMCMNCGCDFSLTLRRHHCHACGKVRHGDVCAGLGTRGRPAAAAGRAQGGA